MGDLVATPRNYLTGLLADAAGGLNNFASKPFGYNNPPGNMLAGLLGIPAIANTLNELSYGGSLTTGKGMTTKPKADTADAALGLLGLAPVANAGVNTAVRGAQRLEPAIGRAVTATMDRGGFPAMALDAMANKTVSPATVWHGSPHKFDRFDASKIGTGEGAQAYGHGLYLAENPGVAREYQTKLSSTGGAKNLAAQYGDIDGGIAEATKRIEHYKKLIADGGGGDLRRANGMLSIAQKNLEDLTAMKAGLLENTGALYKVDLPDEHIAKMLDWDKPLSQQHPDVQAALRDIGDTIGSQDFQHAIKTDDKGSWFLRMLDDVNKSSPRGASADTAANLRQAGIPGIRYLDGGSRGTGAGTSNFVVFPGNEGLLTILERNGQPVNSLLGR